MKNLFKTLSFLLLSLVATSCVEAIDAGNVGIKFNKAGDERGVSNIVQVSGWVWYLPLTTRVEEFPVFTQTKIYDEFIVTTQEGTEFKIDPTLNYYAQSNKVPFIYTQFRKTLPEIENGFMKTAVFEAYRSITNSYPNAKALIGDRTRYESRVRTSLADTLAHYGFTVQQLTTKLVPPQSLTDAINATNVAAQSALQTVNRIAVARAQARIDSTAAAGRAQAVRIDADARAYANNKTQQSLTPLLIQQQWIQKWSGNLPQYSTSGNVKFLMNIK